MINNNVKIKVKQGSPPVLVVGLWTTMSIFLFTINKERWIDIYFKLNKLIRNIIYSGCNKKSKKDSPHSCKL